jgi:hypothetical protein
MQSGWVRPLLAVAALGLTAACADLRGMTETLTTTGPVTPATAPTQIGVTFDSTGAATCTVTSPRQDQFGLFQVAYTCAWAQANRIASGAIALNDRGAQTAYRVMLREGLGLVRGNCSDFFRKRGDNQQLINLSRDIVAMGGTTAAAIVGVAGGSVLAFSIIAVAGTALYGGIDTYTKNFLFGVENIESVRTLTMQTLSDNADLLLVKADATDKLMFQDIADAIMDQQEFCKPASIAAAVRLKLRGGTADAIVAAESSSASVWSDRAVMATISDLVGLPPNVIVSDTQLSALCWATTADGAKNLAAIKSLLIPQSSFGKGPGTDAWEKFGVGVSVGAQCERLSSAARAVVNAKIREFGGTQGGGAGGLESISGARGAPGAGSIGRAGISGSSSGGSGLRFVPMTVR